MALVCLVALSPVNYLLFHVLIELSSVAVAITLFSIGWNARHISRNDAFIQLAVAFLPIALLDLLHTLSYKGMGIFPEVGSDLPTQFWIVARGMQAAAYLCAARCLGQKAPLNAWKSLTAWLAAAALLTIAVWPLRIFPACFVEGEGLTLFKVTAEYLISAALLVGALLFWRQRRHLDPSLTKYLVISISLTILSEMTFTLYHDVYGITNILGHLFKLGAVVLVYRALILGAFRTPYQTLFRNLADSHAALDRELDQRRRTETQLVRANQELDAFVRTVSHDLRSPLTVIMGNAELLQDRLSICMEERDREMIGNIRSQGAHMARLLKDLLNMARIGHLDSPPESVETELVVARVVEELQASIRAARCRIEIGPLPTLLAHPSLIYQLLANLINNAVRYAANPAQPIEVGSEVGDTEVRLFVRDHGPGIPPEERERIFEVFYRLDPDQVQGTGIGLASVQKVARFYGGRAWVEETAGGGATFWVAFDRGLLLEDPPETDQG